MVLEGQDLATRAEATLVKDHHVGRGAIRLEAAVRAGHVQEVGLAGPAGQVEYGRRAGGPRGSETGEPDSNEPATWIGPILGHIQRAPLEVDPVAAGRCHRGRLEHDIAGFSRGGCVCLGLIRPDAARRSDDNQGGK